MAIENGEVVPPFEDVQLTCCDCGAKFIFTAGQQRFYHDRFLRPRKRCDFCQDVRHRRRRPPMDFDAAAKEAQIAFDTEYREGGLK